MLETPLSKTVAKHGLAAQSTHTWLFSYGTGNGVRCAIGDGRHLLTAVHSPEVADFLDAIATHRGNEEAKHWLDILLDPKRADGASAVIRGEPLPAGGLTDKAVFEVWWSKEQRSIEMMLDLQRQ